MASAEKIDHNARYVLHDLASPISSLKLNLELLMEQSDLRNRKLKNIINNMNFGIDTLTEIINWKLEKETAFSLDETIHEVYRLFENECSSEGVIFSMKLNSDIQIFGFKVQFVRILANLFSNSIYALKNSTKVPKEISIRANRSKGFLIISFTDNGTGIPVLLSTQIGKKNFTTKDRGHGLGLLGCKLSLSRYFNGKFSMESDASKGYTKVLIGIPLSRLSRFR